ncbi:hypothetical protein ZWY2020_052882, partial [Hordeum vulgare]
AECVEAKTIIPYINGGNFQKNFRVGIRSIFHTIFFHRTLTLVRPKDVDCDLFEITYKRKSMKRSTSSLLGLKSIQIRKARNNGSSICMSQAVKGKANHVAPKRQQVLKKEENLLRKRHVLAIAKPKEVAQRRDIADRAMFDAAMAKLEEEEKQRAEALEKKKTEAGARKLVNEEKKGLERETKQLDVEQKKMEVAEKKKTLQEEKQDLAEKKILFQEAKRREAQQAKLAHVEKRRLEQEARAKELQETKDRLEGQARQMAREVDNRRSAQQESSSSYRAPYKKPRKYSMFDYLRGPPPGA